jgi:hypothetical protein
MINLKNQGDLLDAFLALNKANQINRKYIPYFSFYKKMKSMFIRNEKRSTFYPIHEKPGKPTLF